MKHPNSHCHLGPLNSGRSPQKVVAKHHTPAREDFSDLTIPHRNSSMTQPYKPKDRTVYRDGCWMRVGRR